VNRDAKKTIGRSIILIFLGIAALWGGVQSLVLLIPAALVVWYSARPVPQSGRN